MPLIWITGTSGAGKSTLCAHLNSLGHPAVDADWEGYNHWVDRTTGLTVADPPDPVPPGWLDRFSWRVNRQQVEALAAGTEETTYLCGTVENEDDVRDLFALTICLVVDDETLEHRLLTRTTNTFGKHPEELAAALHHNAAVEPTYRSLGATIVDGTRPLDQVTRAVLEAALSSGCRSATHRPAAPA
ncbi:AAA family ATPase [Umezawaea tangerina]|uniref:Shikimate kinase n=1 Tax=Umezawaea tangerina TaxID=84725 RepID=A0A2T0SXB7_9PSEU|nr:AAA family ATPase [Umezawaea tangerina]PRY38039.1 shikimate kinase [Umezawaea tangerina]